MLGLGLEKFQMTKLGLGLGLGIENFSRSKLGLGLLQIIRYSKLGLDRYLKLGLQNYKVLKVRRKFFFGKIFKAKNFF